MLSKEKKKSLYEKNIRRYETFDTCTPCAHRQSFLIFVTAGQTEDSGTGEGGKGKVGRRYESLRGNKILTKSTNAFLILLPWLPVHPSPPPLPPLLPEELRQAARKGGFLANCWQNTTSATLRHAAQLLLLLLLLRHSCIFPRARELGGGGGGKTIERNWRKTEGTSGGRLCHPVEKALTSTGTSDD